jgi:Fic family protein
VSELSERIYREFDTEKADWSEIDRLLASFDALAPFSDTETAAMSSYNDSSTVRFVYNSNALEGSTLTLAETAGALDGYLVTDKPASEIYAARGGGDGIAYYQKALAEGTEFSEDFIKNLHERTALDMVPELRGLYRTYPVFIRGSNTVPANWTEVRFLMKDLITAYNGSTIHPIEKLTVLHCLFEHVHPFADCNGRTGRLLMNYMLEKNGCPPITIKADDKAQYIGALEKWQTQNDRAFFLDLMKGYVTSEIANRIAVVNDTRHP